MGKGRVLVEKQVVEGRGHFLGAGVNDYIVSDGFLLSFRNVGTKRSDAGRLPKKHNTAFNTRKKC